MALRIPSPFAFTIPALTGAGFLAPSSGLRAANEATVHDLEALVIESIGGRQAGWISTPTAAGIDTTWSADGVSSVFERSFVCLVARSWDQCPTAARVRQVAARLAGLRGISDRADEDVPVVVVVDLSAVPATHGLSSHVHVARAGALGLEGVAAGRAVIVVELALDPEGEMPAILGLDQLGSWEQPPALRPAFAKASGRLD